MRYEDFPEMKSNTRCYSIRAVKRIFLIFLLSLAAIIFFWSRINKSESIDEVFARTIENLNAMNAFRATIEDINSQGERRADIEYTVDGLDWVMRSATTKNTIFEWRKIGEDLFVLNADTGWFWKISPSDTKLPTRVDPRDAINEVQALLAKKTLRVTRMGSEPCGEHLCWRFQLIDPSLQIVERYWWIDTSEFRLVKDQFVIGNGETSITSYDYAGEIEIEIPKLTKDAPSDTDIMTLPGIVKPPLS